MHAAKVYLTAMSNPRPRAQRYRVLLALTAVLAWGCALQTAPQALTPEPNCRSLPSGNTSHSGFHWIIAAEPEDSPALDAWCAGVGPPAVAAGRDAANGAVDSLLIVTWNSNVGGGDLIGFVADLRGGELTDGVPVEHFALLVQEAHRADDVPSAEQRGVRYAFRLGHTPPGGAERLDILEVARQLDLHLVYVPSMRNGRPRHDPAEDRGNAILSTLPLEEPAAIELPLERQRRVVAVATARGVGSDGRKWSVRLANVHLDNRSRLERLHASFGAARLRQARALAASLDDDRPTVLAGDLNSWSFARLEGAMHHLRERFPDLEADDTRTMTMLGILPRRLDHILARLTEQKGAGIQVTLADRYGSDHHPVLGWLDVGGSDRSRAVGRNSEFAGDDSGQPE